MTDANVRQVVIDWLDDNVHFGEAESLITDDEMSFLDHGILTSLGFVQLIVHLEDTFLIKLERKDLTRENFDSLAKIVQYVTAHPGYRATA
ncbi:MAG: acyl carrier protein [Gemmatimonadetes bacterium]|nr:acyl carrier protein [Gemmatimonadota bacterium]